MMATEYTPNYNLDLYASADKPNLRDQYNAAMGKIDTQMKANADGVTNANVNIGTLQTQMKTANGDIESLQTTVEQHTTQIKTASDKASEALTTANQNKSDIEGIDGLIEEQRQQIENLVSTTEQQQIQITGKAPKNHASATSEYGAASATQYGHAKLDQTPSLVSPSGELVPTSASVAKLIGDKLSFELHKWTAVSSNPDKFSGAVLINSDKTLFKVIGDIRFTGNGSISLVPVPGTNLYGIKITIDEVFESLDGTPYYDCIGMIFQKGTDNGFNFWGPLGMAMGSDGVLYAAAGKNNTIAHSGEMYMMFIQTILTFKDLDIEPETVPLTFSI